MRFTVEKIRFQLWWKGMQPSPYSVSWKEFACVIMREGIRRRVERGQPVIRELVILHDLQSTWKL